MRARDVVARQDDTLRRLYVALEGAEEFNRNDVMRHMHWPHWIVDKYLSRLESEGAIVRNGKRWRLSQAEIERAAVARAESTAREEKMKGLVPTDRVVYQMERGRTYRASDLRAMASVSVERTATLTKELRESGNVARSTKLRTHENKKGEKVQLDLSDYQLTNDGFVRQLVLKGKV